VSEKRKRERNINRHEKIISVIWQSTGWPAFTDADAFKKGLTIRTIKVAIVGS
jgi:hypothetical protein